MHAKIYYINITSFCVQISVHAICNNWDWNETIIWIYFSYFIFSYTL